MVSIHPAFDCATLTWFIDSFEAPSLRQLKKLLPPRTQIEGYYPKGFNSLPSWPTGQTRVHIPPKFQPPQFFNPTAPRAPVVPCHEQALALWAKGLTAQMIGVRCGVTRGVISGIVSRARKRGDARAAIRGRR